MNAYQEILRAHGARILITGDSLSYNRYSYDPEARGEACQCGAGMGSWSFALRDRLITADGSFRYGEEIEFDCESTLGLDNNSDVPFTAMLQGRIRTLYPKGAVHFCLEGNGERIVLYFQRRLDSACQFDVYVDGELAARDVCTEGDPSRFAGYEWMSVTLPCDAKKKSHALCFLVKRGEKLTVVGAGSSCREVILNGVGGKATEFFLEHFEERIGAYSPDVALLCLGANDRIRIAPAVLRRSLVELFSKIYECNRECRILLITPPTSHLIDSPEEDRMPYVALDTCRVYDRAEELAVEDVRKQGFFADVLFSREVFDGIDVPIWRADDIHMTQEGNRLLLQAVCERLGI